MKDNQKIHDKMSEYLNNTDNGRSLLKKYNLKHKSIWQMFGEHPDCQSLPEDDYEYVETLIVTVQGSLEQALKVAMGYSNFFTIGCGGRVQELVVNIKYD